MLLDSARLNGAGMLDCWALEAPLKLQALGPVAASQNGYDRQHRLLGALGQNGQFAELS